MERDGLARWVSGAPRWGRAGLLGSYALLGWLTALFIAWGCLAGVDYAYSLWYELLDIDVSIARYAPENHYRQGFEETTRAERMRLFSVIVEAVHGDPGILRELHYHDPGGRALDTLLREPEIVHLEDVANLMRWLELLGWLALTAHLGLGLLLLRANSLPTAGQCVRHLLVVLGLSALTVLLIGPERLFYWLHEWIFPPDHAWFFYYQDSLMTTLMKAPDLFGGIAVSLVLLSLPLAAGLWGLAWWWQSRRGDLVREVRDLHGC